MPCAAPASPPPSPSKHSGRVHRVVNEMRDVEVYAAQLDQELTTLRSSLLRSKAATLRRYFTGERNLLLQAVVHSWQHAAEKERDSREIADRAQKSALSRAEGDTRIQELEQEISEVRAVEQRLRAVHASEVTLAEQELVEARERSRQLVAMVSQMAEVTTKVRNASLSVKCQIDPREGPQDAVADVVRIRVHALLAEIDPRYLAPLDAPSLAEVVAVQRERGQRPKGGSTGTLSVRTDLDLR